MDEAFARQVLFSLWSPVVAVTVTSGQRTNGFIATSATCASFGPPNPMRVTLQILKLSYSYELVQQSRSFAINLLDQDQIELVRWLATASGRYRDKMATLAHRTGITGCPLLEDGVAYLDCRVVNSMDAGDRTVFLADVVDGQQLRDAQLLTYRHFMATAPADLLEEYRKYMAPLRPAIAQLARQVETGH